MFFSETNSTLSEKIFESLELLKDVENEYLNFMSGEQPNGRFYIFEHLSRIFCAQPWFEDRLFTGIGVMFESQTVPQVLLIHQSIQDKVALKLDMLNSHYAQLDDEHYPNWLSSTEYLCLYRGSPESNVATFLMQNRPFGFVTDESSVRLISFNDDLVVAFFEKPIESESSNLMQFKRLALRMLELQGDEIEPKEKGPDFG